MATAAAPPTLPKTLLLPAVTGVSEVPGAPVPEGMASVPVGVVVEVLIVPLTITSRGGTVQSTAGTADRVTMSLVEIDDGQEAQVIVESAVASTP